MIRIITWQIYGGIFLVAFLSFLGAIFLKGFNAKAGVVFASFAFGMFAFLSISANDIGRFVAVPDGTYFEVPQISGWNEIAIMWMMFLFMIMSLMFVVVNMFAVAAEIYKPKWKKNPIIQEIWGR